MKISGKILNVGDGDAIIIVAEKNNEKRQETVELLVVA